VIGNSSPLTPTYMMVFSVAATAVDVGYGGGRDGSFARTPVTTPAGASTSASMSSCEERRAEAWAEVMQRGNEAAGRPEGRSNAAP
jgi:hypothetical protein